MASSCFPGALNPFCRQTIALSPSSDQLALATSSSLVYLYSYSKQQLTFLTKFSPHSKALSCMAYHPKTPGLLVTGGAPNSRVILWLIQGKSVEKRAAFHLQRKPNALIWLLDEELILGDEQGNIYRWNEQEQNLIKFSSQTISEKQNDEIQLFAVANKQKFIIAIGYKSGLVCVCHVDLEKNHLNILHKLPAESSNTICCAIQFAHVECPLDRSTLFYISYGHGCVKVCDYTNGKILGQLILVKQSRSNQSNDLRAKTYYPLAWIDANTLLTGNFDGHLIQIDVRHSSHLEKSQLNVTPLASSGKPIFSIALKDDKSLFTYSFNRKLAIYDLSSLTLVHSLMSIPGAVNTIQACPLQTSCIALGVDTGNVGILDLSSSTSPSLSFLWQSIPADVCHVAWHPLREGRIAYSTRLGHVALYDTLTGRSRVVYDRTYNRSGASTIVLWGPLVPSFSEDPTLAILYSVGDGKLHRWDSPEKNCLPTDLTSLVNEVNTSSISAVAFSDDHKYLSIICSDSSLIIRACPSLTLVHRLPLDCLPTTLLYHPRYLLSSVDVSKKEHWLAVNDQNHIRLIDTLDSTSFLLNSLIGHTGDVQCLAWSPSIDYLLASGSQDKTIRLWNVESASLYRVYTEHTDVILSLIFSSCDCNLILSGSRDQSLHMWHIEQHTQLADQPILLNNFDEEEESNSNSGNKKRNQKPRPNRAEREKKRAEKVTSSPNNIMNDLNSLAHRLLWPSKDDSVDLSSLPDKATLIERIKQQNLESSNDFFFHLLFWSGEDAQLIDELCKRDSTTSTQLFFWMTILNDSEQNPLLFQRTLDVLARNNPEQILEYLTMMVKAKRNQALLEHLIGQDLVETSLLFAILLDCIDQIRDRLSASALNEDA